VSSPMAKKNKKKINEDINAAAVTEEKKTEAVAADETDKAAKDVIEETAGKAADASGEEESGLAREVEFMGRPELDPETVKALNAAAEARKLEHPPEEVLKVMEKAAKKNQTKVRKTRAERKNEKIVARTLAMNDLTPDEVVTLLSKHLPKEKKLNRSVAGNGILFFLMAICGIFMSLPLVMIINNCLKPLDEIFQYPPKIFVRNPTLENFTDLFTIMSDSWVPFSRYILNTIIITGLGTFGHVVVASLAAYPLAKHEFPGKKILFSMVVLSMMFSWTVTQIPNYMIISWLHINNTYLALILPAWQYGMGLYLMKQFMEQLPDSLMESARLDGATEHQIFWKIVMPNVKPAWLTLAIFQFQQMWGNTGSMFLRDEQLKPLQFALQQIAAGGTARAGASAAVTFIIAAVPIIFFLACQSNVLETMTTSGMKE